MRSVTSDNNSTNVSVECPSIPNIASSRMPLRGDRWPPLALSVYRSADWGPAAGRRAGRYASALGSESHIPRWSIRLCAAGDMILTDQKIVLIEEVEKLYKKTKA